MIQHRVLFADDTSLLCSSDSKQISKNTFKSGLSENLIILDVGNKVQHPAKPTFFFFFYLKLRLSANLSYV
jgi:hypothetical protein